MTEFKKERAREARKRYKERRKACSDGAALTVPIHFGIRRLDDVQLQSTEGIRSYIREGDGYPSKAGLLHRICELAESLCLTLVLPKNTKYELIALSEDFHGTRPRPLFVYGSFRLSDNIWRVRKIVLSDAMGMRPQVIEG